MAVGVLMRKPDLERYARIARYIEEHPHVLLKDVQELFGASNSTMSSIQKWAGIDGRSRPAFKKRSHSAQRISDETWLHPGDRIMQIRGGYEGRVFEIERVIYLPDLTVLYRHRSLNTLRRGNSSTISHKTLTTNKYIRIHTGERLLPTERFMEWTFGRLTPSPDLSRPFSSLETTTLSSSSGSRTG